MTSKISSILNNKYLVLESDHDYVQVALPAYAEDADLYEIYVKQIGEDEFIVTDRGVVLMRLSYSYEIDSDNKRGLLNKIINSNGGKFIEGEIQVSCTTIGLEEALFKLLQISAKVSNMSIYSRDIVRNLFMEELEEFVYESFSNFKPQKNYLPINNSPEYVVDFSFDSKDAPLFLFGVSSSEKAKLVTISCLQFKVNKLPHKSLVVFEDYKKIGNYDYERLTNACDKTITNFHNYQNFLSDYMRGQLLLN